ncbi:iron-containing alcohol dehydrogenase PsrA [Roseateles amylovorans]|uniref:Iron-containing alcohol dehydrogenase n=1 Tax=Roseateles amylovorans TaxID=2978473 RepID=A0ABY6AS45_9BURK|nr:iron-containing alcohol dehydrogenase PsrA [Roseateles amylovorans]UXH76051.1 iron-containing alcohol dehydrogenase [Roseateles amylovorans]
MHHFHNPVRTVAGLGALQALPDLLGARRALVLTFTGARSLGLVEPLQDALGDRLVAVIETVTPNPDVIELAALYPEVWRYPEADVLIALGGGSVIDSAKAVLTQTPSGQFHELLQWLRDGQRFASARHKALIAVPTTAGTGSEVTPWATVWDRELQRKLSLQFPHTWPEAAVVDPVLMRQLPEAVTVQSGLDALSHALEAIWNRHANPVSDALAVAAARTIQVTLPALLRAPQDLNLREAMAIAALQAGLAFSNTRTAMAHSMSYPLTLRHDVPHGIACAFTLPLVAAAAIGLMPERDAVLAQALGPLETAPARLESFLLGLGVKTRFADYGVDDDEAAALWAQALQGDRGRNFIGASA